MCSWKERQGEETGAAPGDGYRREFWGPRIPDRVQKRTGSRWVSPRSCVVLDLRAEVWPERGLREHETQASGPNCPVLFFFFLSLLIFESERQRGRGSERGGDGIPSRLHAVSTESDVGLELMSREIMT